MYDPGTFIKKLSSTWKQLEAGILHIVSVIKNSPCDTLKGSYIQLEPKFKLSMNYNPCKQT